MPKKAATARNGAQRNKPKAQKSFELVRPESTALETEVNGLTPSNANVSTAVAAEPEIAVRATPKVARSAEFKSSAKAATAIAPQPAPEVQESQNKSIPSSNSASARLAARRQATQRMQQRSAVTLITSEHFAYVRKDLMRIALFAVVLFAAIIVLYLTLGRA